MKIIELKNSILEFREGDSSSFEKIQQEFSGVIENQIALYRPFLSRSIIDRDDLLQQAFLILLEVCENIEIENDNLSFLKLRIENKIESGLRFYVFENARGVKTSRMTIVYDLEKRLMSEETEVDSEQLLRICAKVGELTLITAKERLDSYNRWWKKGTSVVYISECENEENVDYEVATCIEDITDKHLLSESLDFALQTLTAKQEMMVRKYFGLGYPEKNLRQIAEEVGLSPNRIRQIIAKALRVLRRPRIFYQISEFF